MKKTAEEIIYGGKLQPQALDLEEVVLGAMMLEKNAPAKVLGILTEETFYSDSHKLVFKAIRKLSIDKKPIDILTVTSYLRSAGELELAGGAFYVTQLTNRVASASNIEFHSHILIQLYLKRQLIELSGWIGKESFEDTTDAFMLVDELSAKLLELHRNTKKGTEKDWNLSIDRTVENISAAMSNDEHVSGIPTGHKILDAVTGGWQKTDLIILAGRPGMGKTARALAILKAAIAHGKKCKFFSFEMSIEQLIKRMIAEEAGLDLQDINRGRLSHYSFEEIKRIAGTLKGLPIKVNDNGRTTIYDVSSECRALAQNKELDLIIVDYIQITKGPRNHGLNRNDLIGLITAELKDIAKECDIPVIALAQVSRKGEDKVDKRPELENLRESGSMEQDADVVAFLYRPAYYTKGNQTKEKEQFLKDMDHDQYLQYSEFIIAKHRNGKVTIVKEYFDGSTQRFKEFYKKGEEIPVQEPDPIEELPF